VKMLHADSLLGLHRRSGSLVLKMMDLPFSCPGQVVKGGWYALEVGVHGSVHPWGEVDVQVLPSSGGVLVTLLRRQGFPC